MTEPGEFQDGEKYDNRGVPAEGPLNGDGPVDNRASDLANRVVGRFGILPNFFRLAPETPEITEKQWGFAEAAYLDNRLPSFLRSVF